MSEPAMTPRAKSIINRGLRRWTNYELRRRRPRRAPRPVAGPVIHELPLPPDAEELAESIARVGPGDRLVTAPTFVLSTMRAGSTLLRLILDSHPQICAPHELHLRGIRAEAVGTAEYGLADLDLDRQGLRNLLWDRLLARELHRSGKTHFVNKTPSDALIWPEILACWPDARFIFLHRHPAALVDSWEAAHGKTTSRDELARDMLAFATGMEQARAAHGGLVVRYEDLTDDPQQESRRICEFLGLDWDPAMVDYGAAPHTGLRRGLGDWSERVRSGSVQRAAPLPSADRVPASLRPIAVAWGYL